MSVFEVFIDRPVTTYDRFTRLIEADNADEAWRLGAILASDANQSCPDDVADGNFDPDYGNFTVNEVEAAGPMAVGEEVLSAADIEATS